MLGEVLKGAIVAQTMNLPAVVPMAVHAYERVKGPLNEKTQEKVSKFYNGIFLALANINTVVSTTIALSSRREETFDMAMGLFLGGVLPHVVGFTVNSLAESRRKARKDIHREVRVAYDSFTRVPLDPNTSDLTPEEIIRYCEPGELVPMKLGELRRIGESVKKSHTDDTREHIPVFDRVEIKPITIATVEVS